MSDATGWEIRRVRRVTGHRDANICLIPQFLSLLRMQHDEVPPCLWVRSYVEVKNQTRYLLYSFLFVCSRGWSLVQVMGHLRATHWPMSPSMCECIWATLPPSVMDTCDPTRLHNSDCVEPSLPLYVCVYVTESSKWTLVWTCCFFSMSHWSEPAPPHWI